MSSPSKRSRLSKPARREQLLDVASTLIVAGGAGMITMEGLAEAAGVSKALPYAHFDNADDVLAELYDREVRHLGGRILEAIEGIQPGDEQLVAAIRTYFEVVEERGAIFAVVAGATRPGEEPDLDLGPDFVGEILRANFGIPKARAARLGELVLGALNGATSRWSRGLISRRTAERESIEFVVAGVKAATQGDPS